MNTKPSFVIIGGGVAGLTAAIAFQNLDIPYTLYESASVLQGIGAGFGLAANAMEAFDHLGLKAEISALGHILHSFAILDEQGEVLLDPSTEKLARTYNQQNFAIHRADLHLHLLSKVNPTVIKLGKRAVSLSRQDRQITVCFDDGSVVETDYLIIADGVHSRLRMQLEPASRPRYSGYTCWRATIDNSRLQVSKGSETWGRKGRFGLTPLTQDRLYWYACINAPEKSKKFMSYTVADLLRHFGDYYDPIPQALAETSTDQLIWNDIVDIAPLKRFAYGNILLIGDAAHATTPNMGQGACQAIEDVAVLIDELKKKQKMEEAFRNFERRRLGRTRYITSTSSFIGKVAQWESPFLICFRNMLMKMMPPSLAQRNIAKLLSTDFMDTNQSYPKRFF